MKLDVKDRLIIANQYRILDALYPNQGHADAQEVFESGYELLYGWYTEHINQKPLSDEDCRRVIDVLSMYQDLQGSYDQLADKSGIKPSDVEFPGFDGNTETIQLGLADFLINRQKKFTDLRMSMENLNSHMPTDDLYDRMLGAWREQKRKFPLDKATIQAILAEQIHPSRR